MCPAMMCPAMARLPQAFAAAALFACYGDGVANAEASAPITGAPKVSYHEQGGLLDVKIDPDFVRNRLVYLSYAEAAEQQPPNAREEPDPRLGLRTYRTMS
jgi:glucose/arabinose dehydrogenase